MATINRRTPIKTHEGGNACHVSAIAQLRRSVLACMLWEKSFYESGHSIASRISSLVKNCKPYEVADLAIEARNKFKLRHVPLLLVRELARLPSLGSMVSQTLSEIIQRPDELTEFLAIYWMEKRQPLSKQVKKGLAKAFTRFDEYQLAKYNRDGAIKLRDVLFMCHAKPKDENQAALWKRLVDGSLAAPDTWEVALSTGGDPKETWTRLLANKKLGYMALLKNLRNMRAAGVDRALISMGLIEGAGQSRALPFRFVSAARACPELKGVLESAMIKSLVGHARLPGKTLLLVDISGSMNEKLSSKSDLKREDAAGALACLIREISEDCRVFKFGSNVVEAPARRGFALVDVLRSQNQGTHLGKAIHTLNADQNIDYDRIIVITDEQTSDIVPVPKGKGYMINVSVEKNGIGYGQWTKIDGFSEAVIDFIIESENTIDNSVNSI